jgi:hypothetical protein
MQAKRVRNMRMAIGRPGQQRLRAFALNVANRNIHAQGTQP